MRAVLVANPKGGAGKTTLTVNLSGALAVAGERVALWDLDRQHSSLEWLAIRPPGRPEIRRLDGGMAATSGASRGAKWLILDSAAGLHGKNLAHALKIADKIIVPVQPSIFDMAATGTFLQSLVDQKTIRKHGTQIGIVGMRVDPRTRAASTLEAFLAQFKLPVLTYLRDTQVYANAAFNGLSIFDLPEYLGSRDREQWEPLLEWVRAG